jgi:anaerobic selenocysteine-containing dehydrogenase
MADLIGLAAARHGGKPALKHKLDGEWVEVSYEQLDRTARGAALLRELFRERRGAIQITA